MPLLPKTKLLIGYKLLGDTLFLFSLFFILALIADGLIPGIVTNHISFLKMIFVLSLNLIALQVVGHLAEIKIATIRQNKKTIITLIAIGTLLIFNSLLKLNLYLAFFILLLTLFSSYFLYKNIFLKEK